MTQFEFISVFASLILGLGLAHLLMGAIDCVYRGKANYEQVAYTIFLLVLVSLNWWVLFSLRGEPEWSFDQFFAMVLWSLALFGGCVALYPPGDAANDGFQAHRRTFLVAMAFTAPTDILQAALHGKLFEPWFYMLLPGHGFVLWIIALFVRNSTFHKILATYFAGIILLWAFVVRHVIS